MPEDSPEPEPEEESEPEPEEESEEGACRTASATSTNEGAFASSVDLAARAVEAMIASASRANVLRECAIFANRWTRAY